MALVKVGLSDMARVGMNLPGPEVVMADPEVVKASSEYNRFLF